MSEAYQPENELQQERQTAAPYGNAQPYYQTMPSRRGSAASNNTPREPSKVPCIVSFVTAICSFVCTLLTTFFLLDYLSAVFRFRSYVGEARDLGGVFAGVGIYVYFIVVLCLLFFSLALGITGLTFGIIGAKGQRSLRPMALVGAILSVVLLAGLLAMAVVMMGNLPFGA